MSYEYPPYPFPSTFYDTLYTNVSYTLKQEYPQQENEDMLTWFKRLLYEFMSYLQAKYEAETPEVKIDANANANKKKDNPNNPHFTPTNETIFDTNIEKALEITAQDSDFAIYLFITWLPLIIGPNDYVDICVFIDSSETPAHDISFQSLEFRFTLFSIELLSINMIDISNLKSHIFEKIDHDPFINPIFKIFHMAKYGNTNFDIDSIRSMGQISFGTADLIANGFAIGKVLWKVKNAVEPLFISHIVLKSNLITESSGELSVSKGNSEKSKRKKFNGRKFIDSTIATSQDMSSGLLQTVIISIFRTFYDFDEETISQELYDYLFLKKEMTL